MKNTGKIISISLFAISALIFCILLINKPADSAEDQRELTGTKIPEGAVVDQSVPPAVHPALKNEVQEPAVLKPGAAEAKDSAEEAKSGLKVTGSKPAMNFKDHSPLEKNIVINFNSSLDAESFKDAIKISPEGKFKFTVGEDRSNQLVLTCLDPIPAGAEFTVTIAKTVKSRSGANLAADYMLEFKTSLFNVASCWPKDGEKNVLARAYPYVFFNTAADRVSAGKAIKLSPEIVFETVWREDTNGVPYCVLKHSESFKPGVKYTLSVDTSALDMWGNALKTPAKVSFTVE